jgi:hypothetical protein
MNSSRSWPHLQRLFDMRTPIAPGSIAYGRYFENHETSIVPALEAKTWDWGNREKVRSIGPKHDDHRDEGGEAAIGKLWQSPPVHGRSLSRTLVANGPDRIEERYPIELRCPKGLHESLYFL